MTPMLSASIAPDAARPICGISRDFAETMIFPQRPGVTDFRPDPR
jgi:hypothetical protein